MMTTWSLLLQVQDLVERMVKWLKVGGYIFFRESCFHQSGDHKRKCNPTHYREPSFYTKVTLLSLLVTVFVTGMKKDVEFLSMKQSTTYTTYVDSFSVQDYIIKFTFTLY